MSNSNTTIPPNRKDIAWKYATLIDPKNPNVVTCIFCGKTTNGGIYRHKQHLVGGNRNAKACPTFNLMALYSMSYLISVSWYLAGCLWMVIYRSSCPKTLAMSLLARIRHHLSYPFLVSVSVESSWRSRHLCQAAMKEDEEEEVEIDQRRLPADYDASSFDPTEHRSPPTERVWKLVDDMSGLTLVEAAELSCIMMRKLGMKEMPVVGIMKAGASGGVAVKTSTASKEEKKPEKTAFELKMDSYEAASKLKVIKEIRSFTDLGLKEAKDLVERTPAVLKKGVSKEEAEKIIERMKAVGANVVMQ